MIFSNCSRASGWRLAGLVWIALLFWGPAAPAQVGIDSPDTEEADISSLYGDLETAPEPYDPFQPVNRAIFSFNDAVYKNVLGPVAEGYDAVMPDPAQSGISNFFENLSMPVRAVSSILQGKGDRAAKEVGAFLLDSTVGIAGIRRPSEDVFGEEIPPEDFGQTLGAWGVSSGPYLVLPLLGPSTLRDFAGDLGDFVLDPVYYVEDWEIRWGARGTEFINALPERIELYEELDDAAVDPYIALRNAYLQNRRRAVEN